MTSIKSRIQELFSVNETEIPLEESAQGFNFAKQSDAEITRVNTENTRKRREKEKLKKEAAKKTGAGEIIDPRSLMQISELRLTLKESFLANLIEYLETGKRSYIKEAIQLTEEYPKLKEWVKAENKKILTENVTSLYTIREWLDEEVGSIYERVGDGYFLWSLSEANLSYFHEKYDDHMVIECRVSPDKILIYIPAFTKSMEELIFSGKIEEPIGNPIRKAKQWNECVTDKSINQGLIKDIKKRGY